MSEMKVFGGLVESLACRLAPKISASSDSAMAQAGSTGSNSPPRWNIFSPRPYVALTTSPPPVSGTAAVPPERAATGTVGGIREDLQHVLRGLGPLMSEQSHLGSSLGSWLQHSRPTPTLLPHAAHQPQMQRLGGHPLHIHHHQHQHPVLTPADGAASGGRSEFVVSMDEAGALPPPPPPPAQPPSRALSLGDLDGGATYVANNGAHNNNNNNDPGTPNRPTDALRQSPELRSAISVIEKFMPFLLILLAKLIFDHKIGILVLFGLIITFTHANSVIKREVGKQAKRNISSLLAVIINLLTCIFFIYYVFEDDKLYHSLVFLSPYHSHPPSLFDLLWVVGVTDFVLKLIAIMAKAVVVALPGSVLPFQKKGKYYLFIEQTSQTYRALMPIQPWLVYLLEAYEGVGKLVGVVLCAAYIIAKGDHLIKRFREWRAAFSKLLQSVTYGCAPERDQVEGAGNLCPICQDTFRHPTMLLCKHIFCEECVSMWFDRERTCPMCRAQVADDPTWRDGATTFFLQLF